MKVRKDGEPNKKTAAVIFQQPDFLDLFVDPRALTAAAHAVGALAIACVDPISLASLAPPGEYGADIAVGEGQQLGLAPSFGGPHVGFIACKKELVRKLPGRLVGIARSEAIRRADESAVELKGSKAGRPRPGWQAALLAYAVLGDAHGGY